MTTTVSSKSLDTSRGTSSSTASVEWSGNGCWSDSFSPSIQLKESEVPSAIARITTSDNTLEFIGSTIHTVQAVGYLLGFVHHYRKNNKGHAVLCAAAFPYHLL